MLNNRARATAAWALGVMGVTSGMARVVDEKVDYCRYCDRRTIMLRNNKSMNWMMHLFLAVISVGFWLLIWFPIVIWHGLTKPIAGQWSCSSCGR